MKLQEIANTLNCELRGDGEIEITSVAPIESASEGQISFIANSRYVKFMESSTAAAVILPPDEPFDRIPSLRDKNPYLLFARTVNLLNPDAPPNWGIAKSAAISPSSKIHPEVTIGEFCVVEDGVVIEAGSIVDAHCFIGKNVHIGSNCHFYPNVVIREECILGNEVILQSGVVIGGDGFGYARSSDGYTRIKQLGNVIIGDRVEIGVNSAVDRGAIGPTILADGVKIDNLVQVAHNVEIGENSMLIAQVGISGSTKLGKWVTLAGQVGIVGHVRLGDRSIAAARSGITKDVPADTTVFGHPAREIRSVQKSIAVTNRLPEISRRLRTLEKTVEKITESVKKTN